MTAFSDLLDSYCARILAREPMVMYRFGDGERMLMVGQPVGDDTQAARVDRWKAPAGLSAMGQDLRTVVDEGQGVPVHFGISCPCCDPISYQHYSDRITTSPTFPANLFINANYQRWRDFLMTLAQVPVAVVANERANLAKLPFDPIVSWSVPDDCVNWYGCNREHILARARAFARRLPTRTVVLVAAGPLSAALIFFMHNENPNHTYVDVGSSLDEVTYGVRTRPYMDPMSQYASKECMLPGNGVAAKFFAASKLLKELAQDDVSDAISATEKTFGGWSLSKESLVALCNAMPKAECRILELGGGSSTLFWDRLSYKRDLRVTTVEHDEAWASQTRTKIRSNCVRIVRSPLKQLTDMEVASVFELQNMAIGTWDTFGRVLGPERNEDWTIRNTFYADAHLLGLQDSTVDVLVVDGPHGSGRSLAFPLFRRSLKPNALILIDDFDHYPFLEDLALVMPCEKVAWGGGGKNWVLMRRVHA